jgi:hypothetical protein
MASLPCECREGGFTVFLLSKFVVFLTLSCHDGQMECQAAGHGRGVTTARFHRQDGSLVALVVSGKSCEEEGRTAAF